MKMTYITYICRKCEKSDTVKLFAGETPPLALNCWNCHAGYQMSMEDMLQRGTGMFPEKSERRAG